MAYNIEIQPAMLVPFDWAAISGSMANSVPAGTNAAYPINNTPYAGYQPAVSNQAPALTEAVLGAVNATIAASGVIPGQFPGTGFVQPVISGPSGLSQGTQSIYPVGHPLYPLTQTGGLVFPYTPTITESIGIKYDSVELTHSNENIHAYKNTDNVRINLSDCVWTSETFDQAIYTLAVIHFFRSYSLMDFGQGTMSPSGNPGTGAPPSPMWFSAYGGFMYNNVPVIIERVDYTMPNDVDYVGVPSPGTDNYNNQQLQYSSGSNISALMQNTSSTVDTSSDYTWIPIKFQIGSISLVVQHSIKYWTQIFNLNDFKAGLLVGRN